MCPGHGVEQLEGRLFDLAADVCVFPQETLPRGERPVQVTGSVRVQRKKATLTAT